MIASLIRYPRDAKGNLVPVRRVSLRASDGVELREDGTAALLGSGGASTVLVHEQEQHEQKPQSSLRSSSSDWLPVFAAGMAATALALTAVIMAMQPWILASNPVIEVVEKKKKKKRNQNAVACGHQCLS